MAYTVLARRYRSATFDEVVGQDHVAGTLKKAIETNRIAHAYLFCGTRGTGKTSMARILAKALNCRSSDAPTSTPCGKCDSCTAIARGEDMDVIEIDAASNTQVERTREVILEHAQYRPAQSRFKVYIIDEAHMLSKASFNALLKTLEEPPEHVVFILATTEAEKILPTILSRCQRYDFRNIPTREIARHLATVCKSEKIDADEEALLLVARSAAGSMRDALSLLDRLISVGDRSLTIEQVERVLGLPRAQVMFDLAHAIGAGDVPRLLQIVDQQLGSGQSADTLVGSLIEHFRNLLLLRACGPKSELVEVPGMSLAELSKQAERFDLATLSQDISIMEELRRQVRGSVAARALVDATFVRLALAEQFASIDELLSRIGDDTPSTVEKKKQPELTEPAELQHAVPVMTVAAPTSPSDDDDDELPAVGKVWKENSGPSLVEILRRHEQGAVAGLPPETSPAPASATVEPANVATLDSSQPDELWRGVLTELEASAPGVYPFLKDAKLRQIDSDVATIQLRHEHGHSVSFLERGKREQIAGVLSRLLARPVRVQLELAEPDAETKPAPVAAATRPAPRPRPNPRPEAPSTPEPARETRLTPEAKAEAERDPLVRAAIAELGAIVVRVEAT
jgi:DNA polymerase-3 subunit gamma/tau